MKKYDIIYNVSRLESESQKLRRQASKLKLETDKIERKLGKTSSEFTYDEKEVIRRVFISIKDQMKDKEDIFLADSIIRKTEWII